MQGVEIGYAVDQIQIPQGIIAGQKLKIALNNILLPVLSVDDFDRLPIPFRAVATDLVTGERVDISSGSLTKAIMASMSIPGIFAPVEIDDRILVDGGVVANLSIETARALGAEKIIAVDVSSPLLSKDELKNIVDVTKQVLAIYDRRNYLYQLSLLKKDDILLSLKLERLSNTDFKKAREIIREGESAAIKEKELLTSASVSEEEYRQIKSYVDARKKKEPVIVDFIEIIPPKNVGLVRLTYIRSFAKALLFNITGYFIGSSLEVGNVWEDADDISLEDINLSGAIFCGVKTPLGPLYIGYGIRSIDKGIFYFYLGPVF